MPIMRSRVKIKRAKLVLVELDGTSLNLILFKNIQWKKYVVIGGRVNNNECFESALIREVKEESSNLIDISDIIKSCDRIKYIEFTTRNEKVRVYFIVISKGLLNDELYSDNQKILSKNDLPKSWKEMAEYDRFPIAELLCPNTNNENVFCMNTNGKQKPIYPEIQKYIKQAINQNLITNLVNGDHVFNKFTIAEDRSNTFLNGTRTIKVL